MIVDKEAIELAAKDTLGYAPSYKWESKNKDRTFRACFGASSEIVAEIWGRIEDTIDEPGAKPKHLLWALVFMKVYSTEEIHRSIVGWPSPKKFRKWSWYFIRKICDLKPEVIRLENRFKDVDRNVDGTKCLIALAGTDCPVFEPAPVKKMYSHKLNGPGVTYELAVSIKTGHIVWMCGPFMAGTRDATVFENGLANELRGDEVVEARNPIARKVLPVQRRNSKEDSVASNRFEVVNGRLKIFNILTTHFKNMGMNQEEMMMKHEWCFTAIAVITQLKFEAGENISFDDHDFVDFNGMY